MQGLWVLPTLKIAQTWWYLVARVAPALLLLGLRKVNGTSLAYETEDFFNGLTWILAVTPLTVSSSSWNTSKYRSRTSSSVLVCYSVKIDFKSCCSFSSQFLPRSDGPLPLVTNSGRVVVCLSCFTSTFAFPVTSIAWPVYVQCHSFACQGVSTTPCSFSGWNVFSLIRLTEAPVSTSSNLVGSLYHPVQGYWYKYGFWWPTIAADSI